MSATVKPRKVGNSRVFTIPKELDDGKELQYDVFKSEEGAYTFIPKVKKPFKEPENRNYLRMTDDFDGLELLDEEIN